MRYGHQKARRTGLTALLCLLCLASCAPAARAQEFDEHGRWVNGFTEPWWIESEAHTKTEIDAAIKLWVRIGDDLKAAQDNEWAGGYHVGGDTHGTFLRWSPRVGYVMFAVNKCEARVTNLDFGRVEFSPAVVRFVSERGARAAHAHGGGGGAAAQEHSHSRLPDISSLIPVKWRGDRYFVRAREVAEFGDYAAGLGQYNEGAPNYLADLSYAEFFSKGYKQRAEVSEELPVVPPGFVRFVKRPVEGVITAVTARRVKRVPVAGGKTYYESHTSVTVSVGSADGVRRGMGLRVLNGTDDDKVEITRAGQRSSAGRIVRTLDDAGTETYYVWDKSHHQHPRPSPKIVAGWRLTTSPRYPE